MCLRSCARSGASICLLTCLVVPFFHVLKDYFSITLHIKLGLSHPLLLGVSHCICSQPLDPMGIHLFCCAHGGEKMTSHNVM
jgi:hypothetical protein